MPKTRVEFWMNKFMRNVENDKKHQAKLSNSGWQVIILWECDINYRFDEPMSCLISELFDNQKNKFALPLSSIVMSSIFIINPVQLM
jgi:DNA mismatch endonuclease (patch repair protein)